MNSLKCPQCGLVNFANAAACKRCNCEIQNYSQSAGQTHNSYNPSSFSSHTTTVNSVNTYVSPYKDKSAQSGESGKAVKKMIFGALWAIGGTIATVLSYGAAIGGGKYMVFWGAILFGAVDFLIGLNAWISNKD